MTMRSVVLVDHLERNILALRLRRLRRRDRDGDDLAGFDAVARIEDRAAADRHRAVEDQGLETRARQRLDTGGEHAVEPLAGFFAGDDDFFTGTLRLS